MTNDQRNDRGLTGAEIEWLMDEAHRRAVRRRLDEAHARHPDEEPDFRALAADLCTGMEETRRRQLRTRAGLLAAVSVALLTLNVAAYEAPVETAHPSQNAAVEIACNDMCNADEVYANTYACLRFNPIQ
ncbi:MAG: hypothetical protein IKP83_01235 [Bacteroidales bacterium]|nr:hypothetical protein [Bacteroidales bacterium]